MRAYLVFLSCSVFMLFTAAILLFSQEKKAAPSSGFPPPSLDSPEVHADGSVTFRVRAPNAEAVELAREGSDPIVMQKGDQAIWSVTTSPLPPDYYGYTFTIDGARTLDASNHSLVPNLLTPANFVHVPGPQSLPWEVNNVPRGEIHHHFYKSTVADDERDYYVYTPPGYQTSAKQYPVLYLLHGYSDDASAWTSVGRMNVIFDNLLAQGKIKPMIVVMPLGYGTMEMIRLAWGAWSHHDVRDKNFKNFTLALLTEVIPQVEKEYRIVTDRQSRAIAGLSMGGSESLLTGLNHLDQFAWIGAFSSGGIPEDFDTDFPALNAESARKLRLLWIACGTEDHLITVNRNLRAWLKSKGIQPTEIETPGMHTWMVWRRNLVEFAPLLFK
jgi:enterochelin esterase-like enzyme